MSWMESIAACDDREAAREKFKDWLDMKADVHDEIERVQYQNDVGTLRVRTIGNYLARNLMTHFSKGGKNPVRVIELHAHDEEHVDIEFLLAELTMEDDE